MQLDALWRALEASSLSTVIRETPFAFAAVEIVHVIALAVVFGSIAIVDLRLLGVASRSIPVSEMSKELLRWTWGAFGLAVVSGAIMFAARAPEYMVNRHFLLKFGVMALAGVNMAVFHFGAYRRIERWDLGPTPAAARAAGLASLGFWIVIVGLGRWIGYSIGMHF
jgi:hypothetical protein